jgi:REP element-mobilizing transposase RayT
MPNRPPRLDVFQSYEAPLFFVTFNTHKRRDLLANERVHSAFCDFCEKGISHGAGVGRYVIMPDHVHLFVRVNIDLSLAQWVRMLKRSLSKSVIEYLPHWQEGFFDHLLRGGDSYAEKWEYVRQNPVRAGLATSHEDWPYQGEIVWLPFD